MIGLVRRHDLRIDESIIFVSCSHIKSAMEIQTRHGEKMDIDSIPLNDTLENLMLILEKLSF